MTWEELKEKAKTLGYKPEFNYIENEKELYKKNKGLGFLKNGKVCYWNNYGCYTIAIGKTYDQMYQIMMLLR